MMLFYGQCRDFAIHAICLIVSGIVVSNAGSGGIPVGIAVARQRLQHQETSTSMRNVSLSHHTSHHATSYHHFQPDTLGKSPRGYFYSSGLHNSVFMDSTDGIADDNIGI
jgi:hypothetical protein